MTNLITAIVPNWQSAPQPIRCAGRLCRGFLMDFGALPVKNRHPGAEKRLERGKIAPHPR